MIGIYAAAIAIVLASLLAGRALFVLLGRADWTWLEGAVGLAALIVVSHISVSLPGPTILAVVIVALLLLGSAVVIGGGRPSPLRRFGHRSPGRARGSGSEPARHVGGRALVIGIVVTVLVLLIAAIPFALNARTGVLGEGIYSNDHAVHLYWADWLQDEVGPKPKGIGWGYPVGPHALVATVAEASGIGVQAVFNGLMLAIPALTALTAMAILGRLPPPRRAVAAVLVGMPFLIASFLAQSSFKEMAIALFVLGFALSLAALSREGLEAEEPAAPPRPRGPHPDRAVEVGIAVLAVAGVLSFSAPGLAWFGAGAAIWIGLELAGGRLPFSPRAAIAGLRRAWPLLAVAAAVLAVVAIVEAGTISRFAERIGEVRESQGRLASRLPPWQVLGVWPEGDFRFGRGAVDGAWIAIVFGVGAAAVAAVWWFRRRELAVPAVLAAGFAIFVVSRLTSGIHVEAKALVAAAPLVMLFILRGLLEDDGRRRSTARVALGALFAGAALLSTLLALRATPVGTDARAAELDELREHVADRRVAFLSLDRFARYRLRGADRVQSPGGFVPNPLRPRKGKEWDQSEPIDFDSLSTELLDRFRFALTTGAAYGSSPPGNWRAVARTPGFVLWKRDSDGQPREVLAEEDAAPGAIAGTESVICDPGGRDGAAGVWDADPVLAEDDPWRPGPQFAAGERARLELLLPPGRWQLSLQYHSEVPLTFRAGELERELPASLDGFYAHAPGKGPFWPIGGIDAPGGTLQVEVRADRAPALSRLVGAERQAWLGDLAAVRADGRTDDPPGPRLAEEIPLAEACGRYVDWYSVDR